MFFPFMYGLDAYFIGDEHREYFY